MVSSRLLLAVGCCAVLTACNGGPEVEPEGEATPAPTTSALAPSPGLARAIAASLEPGLGGVAPDGPARRRVAEVAAALARGVGVELGTVAVLEDGDVVARALPGGHLQVSRGLLVRCARRGSRGSLACAGVLALLVGEVALHRPEAELEAALRRDGVAGLPSSVTPLIRDPAPGLERVAAACGAALRAARDAARDVATGEASERDRAVVDVAVRALEAAEVPAAAALDAVADVLGDEVVALGPALHPALREEVRRAAPPGGTTEAGALARDLAPDLGALPAEEPREARLDAAAALLRSDDRAVLGQALTLAEGAGARAALVRGLAQQAGGQTREAERTLRTALVLDPGCHAARLALARLYLAQGRRDAARVEAQAAVERAPLAADAHLVLGLAEEDDDRARARLAIAAALDPRGPDGRRAALALSAAAARRPAPPAQPDPDRHRPLGGNR